MLGSFSLASANSPCDSAGWAGNCSVTNDGSSVEIGASETQPGRGGESGDDDNDDGAAAPTTPPATVAPCVPSLQNFCRGNYEVAGLPDVTLADLASFVPARPSLSGEPAGIGVVGMPTNLVAAASEQIIAGRLFEYDVRVRFTPAAFRFSYGDGSTRTASGGGASWAALGQADFTPTPTSHVYAQRGTYPVSVTVLYSPSVDFGSGVWRPVEGFVEASTGGYDVRIVEVHTALVDKTCLENPRGPGC